MCLMDGGEVHVRNLVAAGLRGKGDDDRVSSSLLSSAARSRALRFAVRVFKGVAGGKADADISCSSGSLTKAELEVLPCTLFFKDAVMYLERSTGDAESWLPFDVFLWPEVCVAATEAMVEVKQVHVN